LRSRTSRRLCSRRVRGWRGGSRGARTRWRSTWSGTGRQAWSKRSVRSSCRTWTTGCARCASSRSGSLRSSPTLDSHTNTPASISHVSHGSPPADLAPRAGDGLGTVDGRLCNTLLSGLKKVLDQSTPSENTQLGHVLDECLTPQPSPRSNAFVVPLRAPAGPPARPARWAKHYTPIVTHVWHDGAKTQRSIRQGSRCRSAAR
jgi:hypothetical protein